LAQAVVAAPTPTNKDETRTLQWLALTLTPGLGPGKARRSVEFFGSVQVRLTLQPEGASESPTGQTASLFQEAELSPHEKKIFALLKADESAHIDEIVERLEPALSSSDILAALFELELTGKVKQLPGKNFVRSF
jgi:predicted Rossmann fold nucleotide-binding protein DprA/Smf involved in DNA uptake